MVYALIGMPLFLLYLANIGDILAKAFKWTYSTCCRMRQARQQRRNKAGGAGGEVRQAHFRTEVGDQVFEIPYDDESGEEEEEEEDQSGDGPVRLMVTHEEDEEQSEVDQSAESTSVKSSSSSDNQIVMIRRRIDDSEIEEGDEIVVDEEDEEYYYEGGGELSRSLSRSDSGGSSSPEREKLSHTTVPVSLSLLVMVSYIILGAFLFAAWEQWTVLDGFYFCFITLSTIGFGDFVPGSSFEKEDGGGEASGVSDLINPQFIFCTVYILLGMAVIAMCFNLMQEKVVQNITSFGKKLGIIGDD